MSKLLWDNTLQEVAAGFLEAPFYDLGQVQKSLGCKDVVVSRRFAIMQSGKPRIIDDWKDGSVLSGTLHPDFGTELEWRGRCIDLSKAYKQVPVNRSSRSFAVLTVRHYETGRPVYPLSNSLPFGASASVFGFNRISRTLWFLASHCYSMMGGVFCDDFPFVEPAKLSALASLSFEGLLRALAWRFSDASKRLHPLATEFDVLGEG